MKRIELALGRNIPGGSTVSEGSMESFIHRHILPRFNYGTFLDGHGLWKGEFERTKIFYIECDDTDVSTLLPEFKVIAKKYKRRFRQNAVMVSVLETSTNFL